MLVLGRKPSQSIMIGSDIRITIVKVERNQVRIGIEAPRGISILRDELLEASRVDPSLEEDSDRTQVEIVTV